ncbi:MAG: FHA domain-containing protein [Dehalococcoidia bacterium]
MQGRIPREARLTILTGQSALGSDFTLDKSEQVIGRQPDCEIIIAHPTVSSRHARIFFYDNDFLVEDLGSTNGTAVNHRAISGPVILRSGDVVQVGEVHMQFTDDVGATVIEAHDQPVFAAPPPDSDQTAIEQDPGAWGASPGFAGDERVSWAQPESVPAAEPEHPQPEPVFVAPSSGYESTSVEHDLSAEPQSAAEPAPQGAEGQSADAIADARTVLGSLASRVDALQADVSAVTDAAGRLESLLGGAERERNDANANLASLRAGVRQVADGLDAKAADLGIDQVLTNLDGLANSPNDLGLLVNVSRDAARYGAIVRLVKEYAAQLRALEG